MVFFRLTGFLILLFLISKYFPRSKTISLGSVNWHIWGDLTPFGRIACAGGVHEAVASPCAVNKGMALESEQEGC